MHIWQCYCFTIYRVDINWQIFYFKLIFHLQQQWIRSACRCNGFWGLEQHKLEKHQNLRLLAKAYRWYFYVIHRGQFCQHTLTKSASSVHCRTDLSYVFENYSQSSCFCLLKHLFAPVFFSCFSVPHCGSTVSLHFAFDHCREWRASGSSDWRENNNKQHIKDKHASWLLNLLRIRRLFLKIHWCW